MMVPAILFGATIALSKYKREVDRGHLNDYNRNLLAAAQNEQNLFAKINILREALFEDQLLQQGWEPKVCDDLLSAQIYLALADAYYGTQNFDKVLEMCRRGLHCDHNDREIKAKLNLHMATVWNRFEQWGEAVKYADLGIAERPAQATLTALQQQRALAAPHAANPNQRDAPTLAHQVMQYALFPRNKTVLQIVKHLFNARSEINPPSWPRFFRSAIFRDIEGFTPPLGDLEKCMEHTKGGLIWNTYHDFEEAKVDLYAAMYFATRQLRDVNEQLVMTRGQAFCDESGAPGLLKARFYMKVANYELKGGRYTAALQYANEGIALNGSHHNQKLKARLYVRSAIARNRLRQYREAVESAASGMQCLAGSNFDFRLKARLLTQKAHAHNALQENQAARTAAEEAIATARAGLQALSGSQANEEVNSMTLMEYATELTSFPLVTYSVDREFLLMQKKHAEVELAAAVRRENPVPPPQSNKKQRTENDN